MTVYNAMFRCPGGQRRVTIYYGEGPFAVCEVCKRGPLAVYSNNTVVMHKRESAAVVEARMRVASAR